MHQVAIHPTGHWSGFHNKKKKEVERAVRREEGATTQFPCDEMHWRTSIVTKFGNGRCALALHLADVAKRRTNNISLHNKEVPIKVAWSHCREKDFYGQKDGTRPKKGKGENCVAMYKYRTEKKNKSSSFSSLCVGLNA